MAIGVKVLKRPTERTSYLRATLKGMALTLQHLFRPKVTMQYPEERSTASWTISGRWRGTPATVWRNVTPTFVYRGLKGMPLTVENEGIATRDFLIG